MNLHKIIEALTKTDGVSGSELSAGNTALSLLKKYCSDAYIDNFGNVIGTFSSSDCFDSENAPSLYRT